MRLYRVYTILPNSPYILRLLPWILQFVARKNLLLTRSHCSCPSSLPKVLAKPPAPWAPVSPWPTTTPPWPSCQKRPTKPCRQWSAIQNGTPTRSSTTTLHQRSATGKCQGSWIPLRSTTEWRRCHICQEPYHSGFPANAFLVNHEQLP